MLIGDWINLQWNKHEFMYYNICMRVCRNKEACSDSTVRHLMRTPPHAKVNSRINSVSAPSMAYQTSNLMTGKNKSKFEYARQAILKAFTKKWYLQESKLAYYITTFSRAIWKALSKGEKQKHTLSSCQECREKHYHLQSISMQTNLFNSAYNHSSHTPQCNNQRKGAHPCCPKGS